VRHKPGHIGTTLQRKKRDRYITDDEYTRLIEAASPTLRVIINMPYLTCQRIGDVLKSSS
jgi:integrase